MEGGNIVFINFVVFAPKFFLYFYFLIKFIYGEKSTKNKCVCKSNGNLQSEEGSEETTEEGGGIELDVGNGSASGLGRGRGRGALGSLGLGRLGGPRVGGRAGVGRPSGASDGLESARDGAARGGAGLGGLGARGRGRGGSGASGGGRRLSRSARGDILRATTLNGERTGIVGHITLDNLKGEIWGGIRRECNFRAARVRTAVGGRLLELLEVFWVSINKEDIDICRAATGLPGDIRGRSGRDIGEFASATHGEHETAATSRGGCGSVRASGRGGLSRDNAGEGGNEENLELHFGGLFFVKLKRN